MLESIYLSQLRAKAKNRRIAKQYFLLLVWPLLDTGEYLNESPRWEILLFSFFILCFCCPLSSLLLAFHIIKHLFLFFEKGSSKYWRHCLLLLFSNVVFIQHFSSALEAWLLVFRKLVKVFERLYQAAPTLSFFSRSQYKISKWNINIL